MEVIKRHIESDILVRFKQISSINFSFHSYFVTKRGSMCTQVLVLIDMFTVHRMIFWLSSVQSLKMTDTLFD